MLAAAAAVNKGQRQAHAGVYTCVQNRHLEGLTSDSTCDAFKLLNVDAALMPGILGKLHRCAPRSSSQSSRAAAEQHLTRGQLDNDS
jgi:hypothetical protein